MSVQSDQAILDGMGARGKTFSTDQAGSGGPWVAIQFVTAGSLSVYTPMSFDTGSATGITYPAGFVLYGPVSAYTVAGTCVAYKGSVN